MRKNQKIYIKGQGIHFRRIPDISDDGNIIRDLGLGEEVVLIDEPWLKVKIGDQEGWVRGDKVAESAPLQAPLTPHAIHFVVGQKNLADGANTIEARKIINDEFSGGARGWDLQCTEYVQYRVKEILDIMIQWPVKGGRNGGKWAEIFRNHVLYKILSEPQTNCAMCFTVVRRQDGTITEEGHVAFVEQAFADGSVKVSEANWPHDGIYNERTISKADWQNKYKAQFVDLS